MRLPDSSQRLAVVGATGSGKTVGALWHLSMKDIETRPYVIYNFKNDAHIDAIPYARRLALDEVPVKPGIYIASPKPHEKQAVERQMWAIWDRKGIGVYIDEGYMIDDNSEAFPAILTQGRSLEIPLIVLSQRPVWMNRFVFSEADFYQVFRLQQLSDRKKVLEMIPAPIDPATGKEFKALPRLPEFWSYYYDVGRDKLIKLSPVPEIDVIMKTFERRLGSVRKTV